MPAHSSTRLPILDVLRGFAIISIMLLHNIEHFDVYFIPEFLPTWLKTLDAYIWEAMFFLFGGKAFAIFALLFGVTFHIQQKNQQNKGRSFKARFAWRLFLLLGFGLINTLFFQGDILAIYAVLGFFIIPIAHCKSHWLLFIATLLLFQPVELFHLYHALQNPELKLADPASWYYFGQMDNYIKGGNIFTTMYGNITNGRWAVLNWNWENGRFFQIVALFLLGIVAARKNLFTENSSNRKFWKQTFIIATILFIPLFLIQKNLDTLIASSAIRHSVYSIESVWANLSFMSLMLSAIILLFYNQKVKKVLNLIAPLGKMSLSNYFFQSIVGATIYYGYGLALYQYTGASLSLTIGLMLSVLFIFLSSWWAKRYRRGPLEALWHKATWIKIKKQFHP